MKAVDMMQCSVRHLRGRKDFKRNLESSGKHKSWYQRKETPVKVALDKNSTLGKGVSVCTKRTVSMDHTVVVVYYDQSKPMTRVYEM